MNRELIYNILKLSLNESEEVNLDAFSDLDGEVWESVFRFMSMHGVAAIVCRGVERLPQEVRPPKTQLLSFIGADVASKRSYAKLSNLVRKIEDVLKQKGVKCLLLKGLSLAEYYPAPELRTFLDVDLYAPGAEKDVDEAFAERGENDIHFVLVGDGRKRAWVEEYIAEHQLQDTVHWVGRHPLESMGKFFASADVLYFALKDCVIFNLTCPAKLQAYMSVGKPVLAMINGDGAEIVEEASCGLAVPAGDSEALADAICKMAAMSSSELKEMGMNGKKYCEENFTLEKNMKVLEQLM